MANKYFIIGISFIALLQISNLILCQSVPLDEGLKEVVLERTEVRRLHSDFVGQDFELSISLPRSYNNTNSNYPVIIHTTRNVFIWLV